MPNFKFSGDASHPVVVRIYLESSKEYIAYLPVNQAGSYEAVFNLSEQQNVLAVAEKLDGGMIGYNYVAPTLTTDPINTIAVSKPTDTRIYYDSFGDFRGDYPTNQSVLKNVAVRQAPRLAAEESKFAKCKWEFVNLTTQARTDDLSFNNFNSIALHKNNNVPAAGGKFLEDAIYRTYDVIDNDLPVIDKLYGLNRLYGALKGSKGYKSGRPHCGNVRTDFTKGGEIMQAMFAEYYPTLALQTTGTDFLEGNGKYVMWLPNNSNAIYGMPQSTARIDIPNGMSGRYVFNENWEGFNNINWETTKYFYLNDPRILTWYGDGKTLGTVEIIDPSSDRNRRIIRKTVISDSRATSVVFFLAANNENSPGDRNVAIYIKPLGIDTLYVNYVDFDLYDLECVYFKNNYQKSSFVTVNPTDITRFDKRRDSMMLPKKYWTQHDDFYTSYANCQSVRPPDVYFRLRNKVTNKVSRLSRAKLTIEANKSVAPAKWKVV
jgi:hypothetical protein